MISMYENAEALFHELTEEQMSALLVIMKGMVENSKQMGISNTYRKIGVADGLYHIADDIDIHNDEIAEMFGADL